MLEKLIRLGQSVANSLYAIKIDGVALIIRETTTSTWATSAMIIGTHIAATAEIQVRDKAGVT